MLHLFVWIQKQFISNFVLVRDTAVNFEKNDKSQRKFFCIYSDNTTNFLGANNKLKGLHDFFRNIDTVQDFLLQNQSQWKFFPPRSPHWEGIGEAAVKSAKDDSNNRGY